MHKSVTIVSVYNQTDEKCICMDGCRYFCSRYRSRYLFYEPVSCFVLVKQLSAAIKFCVFEQHVLINFTRYCNVAGAESVFRDMPGAHCSLWFPRLLESCAFFSEFSKTLESHGK